MGYYSLLLWFGVVACPAGGFVRLRSSFSSFLVRRMICARNENGRSHGENTRVIARESDAKIFSQNKLTQKGKTKVISTESFFPHLIGNHSQKLSSAFLTSLLTVYGLICRSARKENFRWTENETFSCAGYSVFFSFAKIYENLRDSFNMENICICTLQNNQIEAINCKGLSNLEEASFANNNLTSIHGLEGCRNVVTLDLSNNKITRIGMLNQSCSQDFFVCLFSVYWPFKCLESKLIINPKFHLKHKVYIVRESTAQVVLFQWFTTGFNSLTN